MPASATASITILARISCSSTCSSASRGRCHLATGNTAAPRIATLLVIGLPSRRWPNSSSSAYDQCISGHHSASAHDDGVDVNLIDNISQVVREFGQPADGIDQPA